MSDKKQRATLGCCSEMGKGQICHCDKRICLPIVSLLGVLVLASVVAKRRKRR